MRDCPFEAASIFSQTLGSLSVIERLRLGTILARSLAVTIAECKVCIN